MSWLMDPTQNVLSNALDGLTRRQSLISANLANIDTPGYQPTAIDFESALQEQVAAMQTAPGNVQSPLVGPSADVAMRTTDGRQFSRPASVSLAGDPTVSAFDGTIRNDGNKVDLESEMTALSETQLKYSAVTRLENGKFSQLSDVLGGR